MTTTEAPKRAAIYARVSTADQIDNTSLAEQERLCRAAVEAKSWVVAKVYADEGRSGTDFDRPEWRQMLADVQARKVDAVVVAKLDRFSRSARDTLNETERLRELGADLIVLDPAIDMSTPAGRAWRTMVAAFAELERETIVGRTVAGQRAKANAGGWPGGEPPFGWRRDGKGRDCRIVPDERERQVLARAQRLLVRHRMTAGQVADLLNAEGLGPRSSVRDPGARWDYQNLKGILRNESLHTAQVTWGRRDGRAGTKGSHHTRTDRDGNPKYGEPIVVDISNPVFSRAEWQSIQKALDRRAVGGPLAPARQQMLTGRIFGECGAHYNGVTLTARGVGAYRCSARRHRGAGAPKCDDGQLQALPLDDLVWAEVERVLGDPDRLAEMARQWLELPDGADVDDNAAMVAALDQQIAKAKRTLDRAINRAYEVDPEDEPEQRARVERYTVELRTLRNRRAGLSAIQAESSARSAQVTDLVRLAEQARGNLSTMTPAERREVIELLGLRVEVAEVARGKASRVTIRGQIDPGMFGGGARPVTPDAPDRDTPGNLGTGGHGPARLPHPPGDRRLRGLAGDPRPPDAALMPRVRSRITRAGRFRRPPDQIRDT